MIITRSPLRISLGGGGTDLRSYYQHSDGFLIAAAINKYVYTFISSPFKSGIYLKYSVLENTKLIENISHPIIRESLKELGFDNKLTNIEINSVADLPSGTGLGSSGSFTTALLKGLITYKNQIISDYDLANLACKIEIDRLGDPIGKQDQFIASYGGISSFHFHENENVTVKSLNISEKQFLIWKIIYYYSILVFQGAGSILKHQNDKSIQMDKKMLDNLDYIKEIGKRSEKLW